MERHSPLDIPELLDYTMGFLEGSTSALLQCALVARSWVNPAQSRLFRVPHLTNERMSINTFILRSFHNTLRSSLRLLGLVEELAITPDGQFHLNIAEINLVCGLAYTNLRTVKLDLNASPPGLDHPLFPRRMRVILAEMLSDNPAHRALVLVELPSLVYPFELSQLKALSIRPGYGMTVGWDSSVSIDSIQILDIALLMDIGRGPSSLDLSIFPNLQILRIHDRSFSPAVVSTLQTAARSQPPIHTIVISTAQNLATIPSSFLEELHFLLASLPLASLNLEQTDEWDPDAARFFPTLKSRNSFRTTYRLSEERDRWWRDSVDAL
ncbi:hypothetical protein R3P38DRAFT_3211967 [Favolaschia claudopus]|uniref:F-box domain-containing protein n=1 Tax=Favolaschia claudopus TaxID=2862362 RepID=A0AAW0AE74_9AGAR